MMHFDMAELQLLHRSMRQARGGMCRTECRTAEMTSATPEGAGVRVRGLPSMQGGPIDRYTFGDHHEH